MTGKKTAVRVKRVAKGKRPQYFSDPAIEAARTATRGRWYRVSGLWWG